MSSFLGAQKPEASVFLSYEETLNALLTLIGRRVLVLFSGTDGAPFVSGVIAGRLDRGELDERLQAVLLRDDALAVETLFFHVGSRQSGFVLRPDEFACGFWQSERQLTIHLGQCAVTVLLDGDLSEALARGIADASNPA